MKKITLLTFFCMFMVVPLVIGQTSLTSETGSTQSSINYGPAGTTTAANQGNTQFLPPVVITNNFGQSNNGTDLACATPTDIVENTIYSFYDLDGDFGIAANFEVTLMTTSRFEFCLYSILTTFIFLAAFFHLPCRLGISLP